jgi:oxygen-independent coproporphyrinogen-3 oxidase
MMSEEFFTSSGLAADFAAQARMGIYVHVPFCPHICPYCDFVKTSRFTRADVLTYFQALQDQFDWALTQVPAEIKTVTLYFGGGTPSLFPSDYYQPLVEKIRSRFTSKS